MAPPRDRYLELPLGEWYDALADSTGVPGGGSALASALAGAASVLAMCARASGNGGQAAQAASLRARIAPMAQVGPVGLRQAPGWRTPRRRPGRSRSPNTGPC